MKTIFTSIVYILISAPILGQVFWQQDFSNGIPMNWTNEAVSNVDLVWTYCSDTTAYGTLEEQGCPFDFTGGDNQQNHFKSESPENGFACCVVEPFFNQLGGATNFDSRLTSEAIDCSIRNEVYIIFSSHIGVFDMDASENALLRVSTDRTNWTEYAPFPNLIAGQNTQIGCERWSFNPETIMFDISTVAANEETVYLQWFWQGMQEFHWSIDDIILTTDNPIPLVDITLRPECAFHAIMPNFDTPLSQIDTAYFLTDAAQFGLETLNDVEIIARVINTENGEVLYEEQNIVEELIPNQNNYDLTFPPYIHEAGIGDFNVVYTISEMEEDQVPDNNFFEYPFRISDDSFFKNLDTDSTTNIFPLNLNQDGFIVADWSIGNYFHIPNGEGYFLDEVTFEIPNRTELEEATANGDTINYFVNPPEIVVDIFLYKWDNANGDDFATLEEYEAVGTAEYLVTGGDGNKPNIVKLENLISGDSNIPLEDNQDYFIAIEYDAIPSDFNKLFAVKASTPLNYDAMIQAHFLENRLRFGAMSKIGDTKTYSTFAFGGEVIPHIGINLTNIPTATSKTLVSNDIVVSPNPTHNRATILFDFDVEKNAKLKLLNLHGSHIRTIPVSSKSVDIDCSNLANGTYLIQYSSDDSRALKKLVVLH